MKKMNIEDVMAITAITQQYEVEIENYLIEEDGEVLQDEFAEIVLELLNEFEKESGSMVDNINNKVVDLQDVIEKMF